MKFYGVQKAMIDWREILVDVLNKECNEVVQVDDIRYCFEVEMQEEDIQFLMKHYWYEKQVGQDMPWNWRVAFEK
jgi:hypothetical protein